MVLRSFASASGVGCTGYGNVQYEQFHPSLVHLSTTYVNTTPGCYDLNMDSSRLEGIATGQEAEQHAKAYSVIILCCYVFLASK